jgi:hypothetical protein
MSWRSANDLYRQPLSIDNTAGAGGAFDATIAIPADWDHFWSTVLATGYDMRVTAPDGVTVVTKLDLASFNTTTKVGTIEIQDTAPAAGMLQYWLYWGDSTLTSGLTSFVPASAKTGYIDLGAPVPAYFYAAQAQERLGDTAPKNTMAKTSDTTVFAWVDFSGLMQRRYHAHPTGSASSRELECLSYVTIASTGGLTVTTTGTRYEVGASGAAIVRVQMSGGTTGTDYIVTVTAVTTLGRTLTAKIEVLVRDMNA